MAATKSAARSSSASASATARRPAATIASARPTQGHQLRGGAEPPGGGRGPRPRLRARTRRHCRSTRRRICSGCSGSWSWWLKDSRYCRGGRRHKQWCCRGSTSRCGGSDGATGSCGSCRTSSATFDSKVRSLVSAEPKNPIHDLAPSIMPNPEVTRRSEFVSAHSRAHYNSKQHT